MQTTEVYTNEWGKLYTELDSFLDAPYNPVDASLTGWAFLGMDTFFPKIGVNIRWITTVMTTFKLVDGIIVHTSITPVSPYTPEIIITDKKGRIVQERTLTKTSSKGILDDEALQSLNTDFGRSLITQLPEFLANVNLYANSNMEHVRNVQALLLKFAAAQEGIAS